VSEDSGEEPDGGDEEEDVNPFDRLDSVMAGADTPFETSRRAERTPSDADGDSGDDGDADGDSGDDGGSGDDGPLDDAFSLDPGREDSVASDPDTPFQELQSDVGEGSGDTDFDRLFEEMFTEAETDGLDGESVWEELEGAGVEEASGEEHIVPTREFCARCEHVADPPEVRCTYEGSEIVEFVDEETVRVRNCPIVARRLEIGEMD